MHRHCLKGRPGAVVRAVSLSHGRGFEAASPQILRGEGLPRFFPSLDPAHVGASGTRSALMHRHCFSSKKNYLIQLYLHKVVSSQ